MTSGLAQVTVVAGMPTRQGRHPGNVMPGATTAFVKLLREQGFEVDFAVLKEDREYVDLNSAEIWLPVLLFAAGPVWDATIQSLIGAIKSFFAGRRVEADEEFEFPAGTLHVKCAFEEVGGSRREFDAHGPAAEVVKSLREFGKID